MLFIYKDPYNLEGVVNTRIRDFLHSYGYPNAVVSRDLITDTPPDIMVWSRIVGPAVEVSQDFQYDIFQISVSCEGTLEKDGREISSEICSLLRAGFQSMEMIEEPITNLKAGSGAYLTNGLEGFNRPAYTFTLSVYQTTQKLTV